MALIKNIAPLRIVVCGGSYAGAAIVGKIIQMERTYPGRLRLCGVVASRAEHGLPGGVAEENHVPVWRTALDASAEDTVLRAWNPEVIYEGGYGADLPVSFSDYPRLGGFALRTLGSGYGLYESDEGAQNLIASLPSKGDASADDAIIAANLVEDHLALHLGLPAQHAVIWGDVPLRARA